MSTSARNISIKLNPHLFIWIYLISSVIAFSILSFGIVCGTPYFFPGINGFFIIVISAAFTIVSNHIANKKIIAGNNRFFDSKELRLLTKVSTLLVSFTQLLFIIMWWIVIHHLHHFSPKMQFILELPGNYFGGFIAIYFVINFIQFFTLRVISGQYNR